jgi:hypothetical protein
MAKKRLVDTRQAFLECLSLELKRFVDTRQAFLDCLFWEKKAVGYLPGILRLSFMA